MTSESILEGLERLYAGIKFDEASLTVLSGDDRPVLFTRRPDLLEGQGLVLEPSNEYENGYHVVGREVDE